MNTLRIAFVTALLSASSAYADPALHWTAAIGTGRASSSASTTVPTKPAGVAGRAHWSAFIGTGRAFDGARIVSTESSTVAPLTVSAHWTAGIGTGRAAEWKARTGLPAVSASRAQP
jgi:hypothetical protein